MFLLKNKAILLSLLFVLSFAAAPVWAQNTPVQRLEVMRQKVETMRRSLDSALSVMKDDSKDKKKDDKSGLETPVSRLKSLEKDASRVQSEINNLRGKIDRSEKYEISDVDQLETSVSELQTRVDNTLTETASARANPTSDVGKPREIKEKTRKLLWIIPIGKERDEFEELIGNVTPGRD